MNVHLIDGTYELFRHHFGAPSALDRDGREVGGVRGVLASVLGMLNAGVTHLAVATDHVIESFRNELWPGYKTGAGIPEDLLGQFRPLEEALMAMGVQVWAMEELEADDGLASGAARAARDPRVECVYICTPDKDLSQCVVGNRVVQWDRRRGEVRNEQGVISKFGVPPASIPDYLALVGDSADGFPGVQIVMSTRPSVVHWRTVWSPSSVQNRVPSGARVSPWARLNTPSPHERRKLPSRSKTIIGWSPRLKT